ncbi:asparagine synthase C-terminal domain-containing protein, partial [Bacillus mycoides]
ILTGFAGDHLLSGTLYITKDYCNKFKFKKAFSFLTEYSMYTNASAFKNMINYMIKPDIAKEFIGNNESDYYKLIKRKLEKIKTYNQKELYFQITNAKSHLYTDRTIGGLTGADIYHPFLDRRLIEFIYRIPGELRIKPDYSKYILRESMREYLTPAIVDRLNKTAHLAYTYKSLKKNWSNIIKAIENPSIVSELKLTTAEEWKISLGKWRNGIDTPSDFLTLLSIELWYRKFNQK